MEKIILEIKNSEGGDDSKLLVKEMKKIYLKAIANNNFKINSLSETEGRLQLCL